MSNDESQTQLESQLSGLAIYDSYKKSKFLSIKVNSYFQVYEELFARFRGKPVVFVEIGILNGGSLFMWREYLGPAARIIGVDLNPSARRWEEHGFEIHVGSQSDPGFWDGFFSSVGSVDVVLDDGGHTNEQQIITAHHCLPHIRDGGMLVVEDVHASYVRAFGNPSPFSFMEYCKHLIDGINARFSSLKPSKSSLNTIVWSMSFFESIVCFHVDRSKSYVSTVTSNQGQSLNAEDYRHHDSAVGAMNRHPYTHLASDKLLRAASYLIMKWNSRSLKRYFP